MPELPEVQTVVTQLEQKIVGKQIISVWSDWPKKIQTPLTSFRAGTKGSRVIGTRRLGKHIVIDLDNHFSIVIHLKMTGHLLVKNDENRLSEAFINDPYNGYIHHRLTFSDNTTLEFSDMRKFGWLMLAPTGDVITLKSIASLGVDALAPSLTTVLFRTLLTKRSKRSVGEVLLEQQVISGIGNIYRSEALFLAGVVPYRTIRTLTDEEWSKLLPAIKKVLRQAVQLRGMSDGDFRDTDGLEGRFKRALYVYGRSGQPCKKCGTIVERKKLGSRSIFFCSRCQK